MRDCPKCGAHVDGLVCSFCGEGKAKRSAERPAADPTRWLCANEEHGQRCAKLGVYTSSTKGSEQWYCADHFAPLRGMSADRTADGSQRLAAILTTIKAGPKPVDAEAIAERLAIQAEGA